METRNLLAVCLLAVGGCDMGGPAGVTDDVGPVTTLEVSVNADGTITLSRAGFEEAVNAGTPIRAHALGIDGETLYDVTGQDLSDLLQELRGVWPGGRLADIDLATPEASEALAAVRGMVDAMPSVGELLEMTPSERAQARKGFEDAVARAQAMKRAK